MLNGEQNNTEIVRIGSFALIADGQYVQYDADDSLMLELPRQPSARYTNSASDLQEAGPGEARGIVASNFRTHRLLSLTRDGYRPRTAAGLGSQEPALAGRAQR